MMCKDAPELMRNVKEVVSEEKEWEVDFSGSFFSNEKMMGELTVILFVSLLLMYLSLRAIREFPATADCLDGNSY